MLLLERVNVWLKLLREKVQTLCSKHTVTMTSTKMDFISVTSLLFLVFLILIPTTAVSSSNASSFNFNSSTTYYTSDGKRSNNVRESDVNTLVDDDRHYGIYSVNNEMSQNDITPSKMKDIRASSSSMLLSTSNTLVATVYQTRQRHQRSTIENSKHHHHHHDNFTNQTTHHVGHHSHYRRQNRRSPIDHESFNSFQDQEISTEQPLDFPVCRHRDLLPPWLYKLDTCAHCYRYMYNGPELFSRQKLHGIFYPMYDQESNKNYSVMTFLARNATTRRLVYASLEDPDEAILDTFASEIARGKWEDCCLAVVKLCSKVRLISLQIYLFTVSTNGSHCVPTWDGWQCWGAIKAGTIAERTCPDYIYFLQTAPQCKPSAEKECDADGTWHRKVNGSEWTDYNPCGSTLSAIEKRRTYVHVASYAVSIITLMPAILIFFSYKQLRVHRIILHQNLFFSMLLNGILVIALKITLILGTSIVNENGVGCRFLFIMTKYSRISTYMWMLSEGFYLHKLIAAAFAEQKSLLIFYLIGWVFPIIPTAVYAGFRLMMANERCWVVPQGEWEWLLNGPSLLSLLVNVVFLINIIRVLVTKLRANHSQTQEPSQYRKAVRATLVLLPVFGVHFIITIYRPPGTTRGCLWTELYFYTNDIVDGIQGCACALIFCYCNEEVLTLMKRTYTRWKEGRSNGFSGRDHKCNSCICWKKSRPVSGQARASRGGSMVRSTLSTHVYSSVPPSPETLGNMTIGSTNGGNNSGPPVTRLTLTTTDCNNITIAVPTNNSIKNKHTTTTAINGKPSYVTASNDCSNSETRLLNSNDAVELKCSPDKHNTENNKNGSGANVEHQL